MVEQRGRNAEVGTFRRVQLAMVYNHDKQGHNDQERRKVGDD